MVEEDGRTPGSTVGSLLGLPLGATPGHATLAPMPAPARAGLSPLPAGEPEGAGWVVRGGDPYEGSAPARYRPDGVEALDYDNPFGQLLERVWFDGKVVFAVELGAVDVDPERVKVAQEYQIVYAVELDEQGKPAREPERVPGQYNIYDSVPGMERYSPIWQFTYVIVPRDYRPNALRSAADCLASGYRTLRSRVFEN